MYWASWPKNQHSQNIARNPNIFVVLYKSDAPEGQAIGVYMEMRAKKLISTTEIAAARRIYTTNFGEDLSHQPFSGRCPRRLYKASLEKLWFNTDGYIKGSFVDIRKEVKSVFPA